MGTSDTPASGFLERFRLFSKITFFIMMYVAIQHPGGVLLGLSLTNMQLHCQLRLQLWLRCGEFWRRSGHAKLVAPRLDTTLKKLVKRC